MSEKKERREPYLETPGEVGSGLPDTAKAVAIIVEQNPNIKERKQKKGNVFLDTADFFILSDSIIDLICFIGRTL